MSTITATTHRHGALPEGRRQDSKRIDWAALLYLAPSIALLGLLFAAPVAYAFFLAFTNLQLVGVHAVNYSFTGLTNVRALTHDPTFAQSTRLSVIFLFASAVVGQTVLGLVLALLLRRSVSPVRLTVASIIVVAWVLPDVTAAFAWYAFSQPGGALGGLLGSPSTNYVATIPFVIICLANAWHGVAFSMLMFSASLRSLPTEVLEAAEVDGAGGLRRLFAVVLPMMRAAIFTNLLLVTLLNLSAFTLIWALTQGGPGTATAILPVYMYIVSFVDSNLGYGAMIGLALLLLGALFAAAFATSYYRRA